MRWSGSGNSGNLEDLRGQGGGGGFGGFGGFGGGGFGGGGFGMPIPFGCAGRGMGGMIFMLVMLFVANGVFGGGGGGGGNGLNDILTGGAAPVDQRGVQDDPATQERVDFVSYVFDHAQEFWTEEFRADGQRYQEAKIVLFDGVIRSGCGSASPDIGPHYCPADQKVYLDLRFFDELARKFEAPGDFAQAYVIAHEVGHHVQNLLGTSGQVRELQQQNPGEANEYSVRLELQADCYAGVWANSVYEAGDLEDGDINEGLNAASSVGDDRIQQEAGAQVNEETWTHGSSEQRTRWFRVGFESGDPDDCDTFAGGI